MPCLGVGASCRCRQAAQGSWRPGWVGLYPLPPHMQMLPVASSSQELGSCLWPRNSHFLSWVGARGAHFCPLPVLIVPSWGLEKHPGMTVADGLDLQPHHPPAWGTCAWSPAFPWGGVSFRTHLDSVDCSRAPGPLHIGSAQHLCNFVSPDS